MPLALRDGARSPGGFSLVEAAGPPALTDSERSCLERVNQYLDELAAIADDGTPRGKELLRDRDFCVAQLHARAEELVAGALSAEEMFANSFYYQGRFDEVSARLATSMFHVSPQVHRGRYVGIQFDIGQGITTREQLDLKRRLDDAVIVVNVVLQHFWHAARRQYYIERLVGIGRVGLMEGNFDLANDDLTSTKNEFVVRHAAEVKNRYVRRLGFWALLWILISAGLYILDCRYLQPHPQIRGGG